jgi:hypothetical protein
MSKNLKKSSIRPVKKAYQLLALCHKKGAPLDAVAWVREKGRGDRTMDTPPQRWFDDALSEGDVAGSKLDRKNTISCCRGIMKFGDGIKTECRRERRWKNWD